MRSTRAQEQKKGKKTNIKVVEKTGGKENLLSYRQLGWSKLTSSLLNSTKSSPLYESYTKKRKKKTTGEILKEIEKGKK